MRFFSAVTVLAVLVFPLHSQSSPSVIPAPRSVIHQPGSFRFSSSTRIVLGSRTQPADKEAVNAINEALGDLSHAVLKDVREDNLRSLGENVIYIGTPDGSVGRSTLAALNTTFTDSLKDEGYILSIQRGRIVILGATPRGRYYGVMSLVQLLQKEKRSVTAAAQVIRDWPRQTIRGITDDISRGQVSTPENFRKIIRFLARHKLNVYSPYIEDMFVFTRHPVIGRGRGALTAAEFRDLDMYARRHQVEIIPIFETLGHWENILLLPEYRDLAEFPGAHTVNVSDPRVLTLLDEMIGEIAKTFSSPWFNIAADESWDVGLGANKARVAASDLATVHAEHYRHVVDILSRYNKKPMMYGDVILNNPGILEKIPKDIVIVDWQYWAGESYPSTEVFRSAGFPYVVSPAVHNFAGPFPNYLQTFVNIRNFNREGFRHGSRGLLTSNWNDNGGEALRELNYYGYAWTSECAWNPETADLALFNKEFFRQFFGTDEAGTAALTVYTLLSGPANLVSWYDLWRHPMLPLRQAQLPPLWRIQSIRSSTPLLRELCGTIRATATHNQDHIAYLEFIIRLNSWWADKLDVGEKVRLLTQNPPAGSSTDSIASVVQAIAGPMVTGLDDLFREFRTLWLRTNKEEGLGLLERRYRRQEAYWSEKMDQVRHGFLWSDPVSPSQWIYHQNASPLKRDSTASQVPRALFRKEFLVPDTFIVAKAWIQLIGDTRAQLSLNGTDVGEVIARRSLSLGVEEQRVKAWDVHSMVRSGANVINVSGENFGQFGSAGTNVFVWLRSASGGIMTAHSDSSWRASLAGPGEPVWTPVKPVILPATVVAPDPVNDRRSWIER